MADQEPQSSDTPPHLPPHTTLLRGHGTTWASLTARSHRYLERGVEIGIYGIAGLSILFIFLILIFVVREASPIIFGSDATDNEQRSTAQNYRLPGDISADTVARDSLRRIRQQVAADWAARKRIPHVRPDWLDKDYPVLTRESPVKMSYLMHDVWQPNSDFPRYGIYPILVGTLKTTFIALLIGAPLAILAALYTAFFAPKRLRETIKPVIEILAGFPSVVIGFFCLMTVATIVQTVFGTTDRLNAFVGGIGLSLAVIPIIYTITEDALRAVPKSLREAALAMGATEWQAAYQIVLPAATPGLIAAVLLGIGRAFGETMIALMATGNANNMSWNWFESVRTFAATIGAEMGEVQQGSPHYQVLFFLAVILFGFSFCINLVTEFWVKSRLIRKFGGRS